MRLLAEISTPEVLLEALNELGTSYWRQIDKERVQVVYFSSHRLVNFEGKVSEDQLKQIKAVATQVRQITLDIILGELRIVE